MRNATAQFRSMYSGRNISWPVKKLAELATDLLCARAMTKKIIFVKDKLPDASDNRP
jgi:hypothetical protein